MEHITAQGYGNCLKTFGKGPICYVKEPTTCVDVVTSGSQGPTGYSWLACVRGNVQFKCPNIIF